MAGDLWFLSQGVQGIQWSGWLLLLTLAAGPTLLGFGLYNISLKTLPLAVANLILSLELVFTAVIAYFLLGENMNQLQLLGSALVMGGVLMLRKAK
ncbi:4-amino-4-deoxy-L-arabinose-phosphoundecaprenol flippase subunit ArnE [compost metagenome]